MQDAIYCRFTQLAGWTGNCTALLQVKFRAFMAVAFDDVVSVRHLAERANGLQLLCNDGLLPLGGRAKQAMVPHAESRPPNNKQPDVVIVYD